MFTSIDIMEAIKITGDVKVPMMSVMMNGKKSMEEVE